MEFRTYIYKVLKQVHPDIGCTSKGMSQLNQIVNSIGNEFAKKAVDLCKMIGHITVTHREIQTSVNLILKDDLQKLAIKEGCKAVTQYYNCITKFKDEKVTENNNDRCRREIKAGLSFSVARCANLIKNVDKSIRIGQAAPVYLASILQHLMSEILELSGNVCRDGHKVCITPRHIFLAIENDNCLHSLFDRLNIYLLEGGVNPNIHNELLQNKKKVVKKHTINNNNTNNNVRKPHRFRPGTVALREIKKYQKSSINLTQFAPFERFVRVSVYKQKNNDNMNIQFSNGSLQFLHEVIENKIILLFNKAQKLALHSKRTSVNVNDIQMINELNNENNILNKFTNYDEQFIVNNAIVRLARRSGVKRLDHNVYDIIRIYANKLISTILYLTIAIVYHRRAINITVRDINTALINLNLGNYIHTLNN